MTTFSAGPARPCIRLGALVASLAVVVPATTTTNTAQAASASPAAPPSCHGARATIVGTAGDDVLRGTAGRDVIVGLSGNDRLIGMSGNDVLCGGPGTDVLIGGPGNDSLHGGRDGLVSAPGADTALLMGDYLEGGPGSDRLDGGRDHRQRPDQPGHRDVISFARAATVHVDLRRGIARGQGKDTVTRGLLHVLGTRGDDTITAGRTSLVASTGAGDDDIRGSRRGDFLYPDGRTSGLRGARRDPSIGVGGADTVRGRGGDDKLLSTRGRDRLVGGSGDDTIMSFSGTIRHVAAGSGSDRVTLDPRLDRTVLSVSLGTHAQDRDLLWLNLQETSPAHVDWDLGTGVLQADGRTHQVQHATRIFWNTSRQRTSLRLVGTARGDKVSAESSGPVTFLGGAGRDRFTGSTNRDHFDGGAGVDTYVLDAGDRASNECVSVERDRYGYCGR